MVRIRCWGAEGQGWPRGGELSELEVGDGRGRAGAVLGRCEGGHGRHGRGCQRVGDVVACPGMGGSVSGAGWSGQGGRGTECTPGVRCLVGVPNASDFGQGEERELRLAGGGAGLAPGERRTLVEARGGQEERECEGEGRCGMAARAAMSLHDSFGLNS